MSNVNLRGFMARGMGHPTVTFHASSITYHTFVAHNARKVDTYVPPQGSQRHTILNVNDEKPVVLDMIPPLNNEGS